MSGPPQIPSISSSPSFPSLDYNGDPSQAVKDSKRHRLATKCIHFLRVGLLSRWFFFALLFALACTLVLLHVSWSFLGVEIVVWLEIVIGIFVFWMLSKFVAWLVIYIADKIDSKGNYEVYYAPTRRSIRNILFFTICVQFFHDFLSGKKDDSGWLYFFNQTLSNLFWSVVFYAVKDFIATWISIWYKKKMFGDAVQQAIFRERLLHSLCKPRKTTMVMKKSVSSFESDWGMKKGESLNLSMFAQMQKKVQKKFRVKIAEDTIAGVTSRAMAESVAEHVFEMLRKPEEDFFTKNAFAIQLRMRPNHEVVRKGFALFDNDGDGRVYHEDCVREIVHIYRQRNWLADNLRDIENITSMINVVLIFALGCFLLFVWMIGYGLDLLTMVIPLSSVILGFAFFFGSTGQRMLEGTVLVLGVRPYNVGDRIKIMDIAYQMPAIVKSIGVFSTQVETIKGEMIYIPNQLILRNGIVNYRRTKKVGVWFSMQISIETPPSALDELRTRCEGFVAGNKNLWDPSVYIVAEDIIDTNKVVLGCYFTCLCSWQDWVVWGPAKDELLTFIRNALKDLHVDYILPKQPIKVEKIE